ncbi:MAG TPA: GNAT family N-acetyltransferase [Acidimicrobiia bacterium]
MEVVRHTDPQRFLDRAAERLAAEEARHNLLLGVIGNALRIPEAYSRIHLWTVEHGGRVLGTAVLTPPRDLVLGDFDSRETVEMLVLSIRVLFRRLPGVIGNLPAVEWFVGEWSRVAGANPKLLMSQGVFSLEEVARVPVARGRHRPAVRHDRPLLLQWMRDFQREVHPAETYDEARIARTVDMRLGGDPSAAFWLWEDTDVPVSASGYGGKTLNGIRIGPVYTPPQHRGRGYATSLVAAQSQWLLDSGYRFCFLYTDLANPTSNAVYQRIGYRQVAESAQYAFTSA